MDNLGFHSNYSSGINSRITASDVVGIADPQSSEIGRIGESFSAVIEKWNNELNQDLTQWLNDSQDLEKLLYEGKAVVSTCEILYNAQGSSLTLSGMDAVNFLITMSVLGLGGKVSVKASWSTDGAPPVSSDNYYAGNLLNLFITTEKSGGTISNVQIGIGVKPESGNTDLSTVKNLVRPELEGAATMYSASVSELKNSETKDLFRVMTAYNFKNSNVTSLSSEIQSLISVSLAAINNIS